MQNLFKHGRKISAKMSRQDWRKSKITQKFLGNKAISNVLDRTPEKNEFNLAIHGKIQGGLTKNEMQEAIGGLKTLSNKEKYKLAKEIFPDLPSSQRFIKPNSNRRPVQNEKSNANSRAGNTNPPPEEIETTPMKKTAKVPPAYFAYQPKAKPASANPEGKNKYTSYFDAMKSVARNRGKKF